MTYSPTGCGRDVRWLLAATVILRASRRISATTRYHLWWVTLVIVLAVAGRQPPASASRFQLPALASQPPVRLRRKSSPNSRATGPRRLRRKLAAGAGSLVLPSLPRGPSRCWCCLVRRAAISLARTVAALVTLRRAKRTVPPFPAAREVRLQTWLSLRARGRRARAGVSDDVRAAAVLGLTSPSIVVAPSRARRAERSGARSNRRARMGARAAPRRYRAPRAAHHRGDRRTPSCESGGSIASCTSNARPRATTGR